MMRIRLVPGVLMLAVLALALPLWAQYPTPSPYPISWELKFDHSKPRRILVQAPGDAAPKAYWYITYHVVNNTTTDPVLFYPTFDLLTQDGKLIRSDNNIAPAVFDAVKQNEHIQRLQNANEITGDLHLGEDQSRDGAAIWPEPSLRMGTFNIFVSGFWGESASIKVADKDVILHKSLQLTYHVASDENNPGEGAIDELANQSVMR